MQGGRGSGTLDSEVHSTTVVTKSHNCQFNVADSRFFFANKPNSYEGIMFTFGDSVFIMDSTFDHNLGSLYIFNGYLTVSGNMLFENCVEPSSKSILEDINISHFQKEGQSQLSFQSTVVFTGVSTYQTIKQVMVE
jgi:hypothetical protein